MPKIANLFAVTAALFSLLAAQAGAVDLRSPDAVDAAMQASGPAGPVPGSEVAGRRRRGELGPAG